MATKNELRVEFTPKDLVRRMQQYPQQLNKVSRATMAAAVVTIHEAVPPYAAELPNQRYQRTGELGRSFGVNMGGGIIGSASIQQVKRMGQTDYEGQFGSSLSYAAGVVGDSQKEIFRGRWWRLTDVLRRTTRKVIQLYESASKQLAAFLEGSG